MGISQVWQFISLSIYAIINVNDYANADYSKILFLPDFKNMKVNEKILSKNLIKILPTVISLLGMQFAQKWRMEFRNFQTSPSPILSTTHPTLIPIWGSTSANYILQRYFLWVSEAVARRYSIKYVLLKVSRNFTGKHLC